MTGGFFEPVNLYDVFDRVVVINLKRRPDKLEAFWKQIGDDWPFRKPEVFEAIDGNSLVPHGWVQGGGTWGCLRSHARIMEDALQDGTRSILVLEDDMVIRKDFGKSIKEFFAACPHDWDWLMLGGNHMQTPMPIKPGVMKCIRTERTHGYGVRHRGIHALYDVWHTPEVTRGQDGKPGPVWHAHCDYSMMSIQAELNAYAPKPFLMGQGPGLSDISGRQFHTRFFNELQGNERIVVFEGTSRDVISDLRREGVIHTGFMRHPYTDLDMGLDDIAQKPVLEKQHRLRDWIRDVARECMDEEGMSLGVWHPQIRYEMVRQAWVGPVVRINGDSIEYIKAKLGTP